MNQVLGGVDTHADVHCAAVIDQVGRLLGVREFGTDPLSLGRLRAWMEGFGVLEAVGIEGTGAYGAGLTRHLHDHGIKVLEVSRPNRRMRRAKGKSDSLDAQAAARAVLEGTAKVLPKFGSGAIESVRVLTVSRTGAMKARVAAINTLKAMIVTAPTELRSSLQALHGRQALIDTCAAFRIGASDVADPPIATKLALRTLARRIRSLDAEIAETDGQLAGLVAKVAPATLAIFGMGVETTSALLVTIGDNPDRLRSEAALARLCGVAPIPASSGKVRRHRLHRGGVRSANRALHVAVIVRLKYDPRTRAYMERRISEGLSKLEVIRCLKRYLVREVLRALRQDYRELAGT